MDKKNNIYDEFEFCINNNGQNQKTIIRISRARSNNESTQIARTLSDNNLIEYKIESVRLNTASHKNFEFSGTKTVINEELLNKIIHQFKKSPELYVLHAGTPKLHGFFICNGIYFECYLPGTIYPCSRQHIESRLASADINKIPDITHN